MRMIAIKDAKPGMVLASPITNQAGLIVCQAKTELTEAHIYKLENMNIESLMVEGHRELDQEERDRLILEVEHRFRKVQDIPMMLSMKDIVKEVLGLSGE